MLETVLNHLKAKIIWTCSVGPVTSLSVAFISFAKKVAIDFCQFFSHLLRILFSLNLRTAIGDLTNFSVLKKCNGKLDCLIYEMLFIKKTMLEHTKLFLSICHFLYAYFTFYRLARYIYIKLSNFILFSLESDDMKSSKRCLKLLSLICIISVEL